MGRTTQEPVYVLTTNELKNITEIAATAGANAYKIEMEKTREDMKKRTLHNTGKLLKNYRSLKKVITESVYDDKTVKDKNLSELLEILGGYNYDFDIESIKKSKIKTQIMVEHVDRMLKVYQEQCQVSTEIEDQRRYRIIESLFLGEKPLSRMQIAEIENINESTVSRDIGNACQKLAVLIFGIHGIQY